MASQKNDIVSVALPENVWRKVFSLIDNERNSLEERAERVEGLYREILELSEKELTLALQEIELNLIVKEK